MTINKIANGNELTIMVEGRLDTVTAPSLETEIKEKSAKLFGVTLPLKIITKEFYPTQNREEYFTISAAKTLAEKNIENEIIKFVGDGKIIEKSLNEKIEKDKFVIIAEIKCEKNIIFEEKMLISTGNSR